MSNQGYKIILYILLWLAQDLPEAEYISHSPVSSGFSLMTDWNEE